MYDLIVVGAGVVGPCVATAFARQGRTVLLIERDWTEPQRIVGELLQPAGIKALCELGMVRAVNGIDAVYCKGYYIKYHGQCVDIEYPYKQDAQKTNPTRSVAGCVFDGNDKMAGDELAREWENHERVLGVLFRHGKFISNLRNIAKNEKNVTALEGTVTLLVRNGDTVVGVNVKRDGGETAYHASLVIGCDGIYSKLRKEHLDTVPAVGSYFVGLELEDAKLPSPHCGHVILGTHAPVLAYQTSEKETRMLCAYRLTKPPSAANNDFYNYLRRDVEPNLPPMLVPSFVNAVEKRKFKSMPNQYFPAKKQGKKNPGLILLGDALNMRHPLTGGGMTVGLNDTVLLAKLLHPTLVPSLSDHALVAEKLKQFNGKRKGLDAVINTLSIALYSLFAADKLGLMILQEGCFRYFQLGGTCVLGPIGLLSGMLPFPMLLFNHFFSVAFYAIYCNFCKRGLVGFPLALYEAFVTLGTAIVVFTPYLVSELL